MPHQLSPAGFAEVMMDTGVSSAVWDPPAVPQGLAVPVPVAVVPTADAAAAEPVRRDAAVPASAASAVSTVNPAKFHPCVYKHPTQAAAKSPSDAEDDKIQAVDVVTFGPAARLVREAQRFKDEGFLRQEMAWAKCGKLKERDPLLCFCQKTYK